MQIDLQLETGEYFLSEQKKTAKKWQEKQEKQTEKAAENKRKRDDAFIPPEVWEFLLVCLSVSINIYLYIYMRKHLIHMLYRSLSYETITLQRRRKVM